MKTLVARLLRLANLQFALNDEEIEFKQSFIVWWRPYMQLALLLGGIIYYIFFIWDQIIDLNGSSTTHLLRGIIFTPLIWITALLLFVKKFEAYIEHIVCAGVISALSGLAIIYSVLDRGYDFGAVGTVIVLFFAFTSVSLRAPFYICICAAAFLSMNVGQILAGIAHPGMFVVNNLCILTSSFLGLYSSIVREISARKAWSAGRELTHSRSRVDELLNSMLPQDIVRRIQAGEHSIADAHSEVSIVFADFVNFTSLSRRLNAHRLVSILNELFSRFDTQAEKYGVEKIKTIGDAYMAVCGLTNNDLDHAERAANFAFAMHREVKDMARSLGYDIDIRVGLHVGPIIAGVIGTKRPAFDCWGEAVNVASRLEHSASPGGILISEAAHWRLQETFETVGLEEVELKGLGLSKVFLLRPKMLSI